MSVSITKFAGLHTSPNENSSAPEGALWVADNIVIRDHNVIASRRGHYLSTTLSNKANELYFYGTTLLAQTNDLIYKVSTDTAYTGAAAPADSTMRLKAAEAQSNIYFATATGVKVLESASATSIALAGVGRAPDPWLSAVTGGANGFAWASATSKVAYQVVWGYKDTSGRYIWGAPSGRMYANTTATPAYVTLGVPPISSTGVDKIFRVYRTESTLTATDEPSEDAYLVYENKGVNALTQAIGTMHHTLIDDWVTVDATAHGLRDGDWVNISPGETNFPALTTTPPSAGYQVVVVDANHFKYQDGISTYNGANGAAQTITILGHRVIDYMPEDLLAEPLYTSATVGEGARQANFQPPLAKDIAYWNDRMWFANTTSKHRFYLSIIGASAPEGVQNNDVIVINGVSYTAKTTPTASTHFAIGTSTSPGIKVEETARNLVKVINAYTGNTSLDAFYISGVQENPGQILLEERGLGGSAFSVYIHASSPAHAGGTDARASFSPYLTLGSTSALTSTNDAAVNRVFYSKLQQPEAVPLLNYVDVGSKSKSIRRIVPLRDKLFVFKDDGIFIISGESPFRVDLLDDTVQLVFSDSPATVENQIYCVTRKGVCAVSEAGVAIVSRPIENLLLYRMLAAGYNTTTIFGCGYESEHSYLLFVGSSTNSSICCLVYNTLTNTWVNWTLPRSCARIHPTSDVIYSGEHANLDGNRIYVEAKGNPPTLLSYYEEDWASHGTISASAAITSETDAAGRVFVECLLAPTSGGVPKIPGIGDTLDTATFSGRIRSYIPRYRTSVPSGSTLAGGQNAAHSVVLERLSGTLPTAGQTYSLGDTAIHCSIGFAPQAAGAPSENKQFTEVQVTFRRRRAYEIEAEFTSDASRVVSTAYSLLGHPRARTTTTDGETGYVTEPLAPLNRRIPVPAAAQRATQLNARINIGDPYHDFEITGFTFVCDKTDSHKGSK